MPLEKAKPGSPGFGRNIAEMEKSGHPAKQAIAAAYSATGETKDADDPDIAPSVAETEVHALNRVPEAAPQPMLTNQYEDPSFRNPTIDTVRPSQAAPPLATQNAMNRAYWNGRR